MMKNNKIIYTLNKIMHVYPSLFQKKTERKNTFILYWRKYKYFNFFSAPTGFPMSRAPVPAQPTPFPMNQSFNLGPRPLAPSQNNGKSQTSNNDLLDIFGWLMNIEKVYKKFPPFFYNIK